MVGMHTVLGGPGCECCREAHARDQQEIIDELVAAAKGKFAMHDRTGKPLKKGDKVTISAVITQLHPMEDYCNVSVETEYGRRPDGQKETISAINTAVLDKVD